MRRTRVDVTLTPPPPPPPPPPPSLSPLADVDGLTHVWREGMPAWLELGQVSELKQTLLSLEPEEEDGQILPTEIAAYDPNYEFDADAVARRKAAAGAVGAAGAEATASGAPGAPGAHAAGSAAAHAAKPKRVRKKKTKFVDRGGSNVYVSGLPSDASIDEIAECFKVAGMIKSDHEGKLKVKVYTDADGTPKGDALLTFLKQAKKKKPSHEFCTRLARVSHEFCTSLTQVSHESRTSLTQVSHESRTQVSHTHFRTATFSP